MKRLVMTAALVAAVVVPAARVARAQGGTSPVLLDPKVLEWDNGPSKIDVSKYPADMKQKYHVFSDLCGRCHSLARAINCDFVLPDDWERYIKKMMRRGKGLIEPDEAAQIYEFAVYDSKIRKKALYEQRLATVK
jgi:hypothetical protein